MKFIITESQANLLSLEKISDIMKQSINVLYPDNYLDDNNSIVFSNEDEDGILFYNRWKKKEFYIGAELVEELYNMIGLSIFDMDPRNVKNRDEFDELIKVFARRHYGWTVDKVWFHWY